MVLIAVIITMPDLDFHKNYRFKSEQMLSSGA